MSKAITLLLGVHAHQPVGNFPEVIAEAHERCYRPFLETVHRYPRFRFSAHFSGWLLDELLARYPADMQLLFAMVERGQAELFGAGDCEPVLAAIPTRDRLGQLAALADKLELRFGQRPQGAWLTERVWESCVVPSLARSGIHYVTVDDYHFLCTGRTQDELDSFFTTEEDGVTVDLFPISEDLRYRLPFSPADEAIRHLEYLADAGQSAAIYFDDIEKFGIWPDTYDWVYVRRWLEQFIEGVLASPLIETSTYARYHARTATRGIVYLPTASYSEMNEWTLPAPAAELYAALVRREKTAGTFELHRPFLRGGIWRNFLSRYPEANWMHKRMLGLSSRLAGLDEAPASLRDLLYRAQANDAYWHGLFGGLYLPHLRRAVWSNLIALERALDERAPRPQPPPDPDADGHTEIFLHNPALQAVIRLDGLAAIHELDSYPLGHNFGDTLRRTPEHYHEHVRRAAGPSEAPAFSGIASAHHRLSFKHAIDPAELEFDTRGRLIAMDSLATEYGAVETLIANYVQTERTANDLRFAATLAGAGRIDKRISVTGSVLEIAYGAIEGRATSLVSRWYLALPSCDGFSGRYILADGAIPCGFGQELVVPETDQITLDDRLLGGSLRLRFSRPIRLEAGPHHTVSQSEAGFERVMQAACLRFCWTGSAPLTVSAAIVVD